LNTQNIIQINADAYKIDDNTGKEILTFVWFKILTAVKTTLLFWVVRSCGLAGRNTFGGNTAFIFWALYMETVSSSKRWYRPACPHDVTTRHNKSVAAAFAPYWRGIHIGGMPQPPER
jgi:hypothetical protein